MKPTSPEASQQPIWEHGTTSGFGTDGMMLLRIAEGGDPNNVYFRQHNPAGNYGTTTSAPSLSGWHEFAVTIDATNNGPGRVNLFEDYQLIATSSTTETAVPFLNDYFTVGSNFVPGDPNFSGLLDEMRISSGILNPSQFLVAATVPEPASAVTSACGLLSLLAFASRRASLTRRAMRRRADREPN